MPLATSYIAAHVNRLDNIMAVDDNILIECISFTILLLSLMQDHGQKLKYFKLLIIFSNLLKMNLCGKLHF